MITRDQAKTITNLFRVLSQPTRVRILLAIGTGEACVCHLEAALNKRQAYISQHLMTMRQAGLVTFRRDGRNVYYRLSQPDLLGLIEEAARQAGLAQEEIAFYHQTPILAACPCPHCEANIPLTEGCVHPTN